MTKISLINVFTPAQEIQESGRFAGRSEQLEALSTALQSQGAQIVMYGQRGVGKSSLARQLQKLAVNDEAVVQRLEHEPTEPLDFLPMTGSDLDNVRKTRRKPVLEGRDSSLKRAFRASNGEKEEDTYDLISPR